MRYILPCLLLGLPLYAESNPYPATADSIAQQSVAKGQTIKGSYQANASSLYPGTERDYTLHLPAGYQANQTYGYIVFQDGVIYQGINVLDNLIAKGDIPPVIGIFIRPGVVPAAHDQANPRFNRSFEYDNVSDRYSRFLFHELLPHLEKKHGVKLSQDPNQTAIVGSSSGGIAAFMVAWHRPDRIRRVFTGVGTYVGLRGGDQITTLVRKMEPRPIKIFLQDGSNDLNIFAGDWWMANLSLERSLNWAGYAVNHAWGEGGHNGQHATQVMPDAMRWLWQDWQKQATVNVNPTQTSQWRGFDIIESLDQSWQLDAMPITGPKVQVALPKNCRDAVTNANGLTYALFEQNQQDGLWIKDQGDWKFLMAAAEQHSLALSPDQSLLYFTSPHSRYVQSAQLRQPDQIDYLQDFGYLHDWDAAGAQAKGITCDSEGRFYVSTALGIQVLEQAGRVHFIIPTPEPANTIFFSGEDLKTLTIRCGNKTYSRRVKVAGVQSQNPPIKPTLPRL